MPPELPPRDSRTLRRRPEGPRAGALAVAAVLAAGAAPAAPAPASAFRTTACDPQFERLIDDVEIHGPFGQYPAPWRGGWEKARPQLLDVDVDGDLDLFVAEEDGRLRFFRNDATGGPPLFVFQTDDYAGVHERYFARFVDIDVDGDWDLLVEAPKFETEIGGGTAFVTGAYLYTNEGTPTAPVWANLSSHPDLYCADENGDPIGFENTSPDFLDLDGDGDLDLVMGQRAGTGRVALYRNVGGAGVPVFRLETESYGDIVIQPGYCIVETASPVVPSPIAPPWTGAPRGDAARADGRHGYMQFVFHDLDGDSLPDLFVGDQFNSNVYHWRNTGGSPSPVFECQTEGFFVDSNGLPGVFPSYLLPTFGDLDGDGDSDALLGSGSAGDRGVSLYINVGDELNPDLRPADPDALPEFDLGRSSVPVFADLDGDSRPDLFVGIGSEQTVGYWRNAGSPEAPRYESVNESWMPQPGSGWASPEFADLDADGDLDFFVGRSGGGVRYWRNVGSDTSAAWLPVFDDPAFGDSSDRLFRLHVDDNAAPRFFDGDGDGDLDVVMGSWTSTADAAGLLYFENVGTPTAHEFVFVTDDFQSLGDIDKLVVPAFGDLDRDGDDDLVVGKRDGTLAWFRNVGTSEGPLFVPEPGLLGGIDVGREAAPALVDIDGDGDLDLVVGETGGGLNLYRNVSLIPAPPTPFSLIAPAVDEAVPGNEPVRFDWESSFDPDTGLEVEYELRLAASEDLPLAQWQVIGGISGSRTDVRLWRYGFRFEKDFWWTVTARNGCAVAPTPAVRHGVNSVIGNAPLDEPDHLVDHPERERVFRIVNAYPSPSWGNTFVEIELAVRSRLRVEVYDLSGRRVRLLFDGERSKGRMSLEWDGRGVDGLAAGPGIYLVRAEAGGRTVARRIVRLR